MRDCLVLASIASRKSIAVAKSIKELLKLRVIGVAHTDHPHVFSRYFDRVYIVRVDRSGIRWVYTVLGIAEEHHCRAVLPIDFVDFYMFSKHSKLFEELGITLISPPHESIVVASDRVKCWETLGDIANFPSQVLLEREDNIENVYRLRPPLVVKNLGDTSNPTFHLDYETAIKDALSRAPVLVQEYVEGIARGYYALAFNGIPLLEFTHQRIIEYTPIGGASLGAQGIVKDPRLFELGRKIIKKLKWNGMIMVETRYSDEKGIYYVIELNPKFWGSIDLPETLGYKFSALLVALHLYGYNYALKLKKKLKVRSSSFVWLLDALRYIPKMPKVWLKLVNICMRSPIQCDIDLTDMPRCIDQTLKAFQRFKREKNNWIQYLDRSREQLKIWLDRYRKFLLNPSRVVVIDFDATLVRLPIDWNSVRRSLIKEGIIYPWESINRALTRYWLTDKELYHKLSELVKHYEFSALNNIEVLISLKLIEKLRERTKICIATKQPVEIVVNTFKLLGTKNIFDNIVGRDSGWGPIKTTLFKKCVELCNAEEAIVIDDKIDYLIDAYRLGYTPILATSNSYLVAKSYRLGIPSGEPEKIIKMLLEHTLSYATKQP